MPIWPLLVRHDRASAGFADLEEGAVFTYTFAVDGEPRRRPRVARLRSGLRARFFVGGKSI